MIAFSIFILFNLSLVWLMLCGKTCFWLGKQAGFAGFAGVVPVVCGLAIAAYTTRPVVAGPDDPIPSSANFFLFWFVILPAFVASLVGGLGGARGRYCAAPVDPYLGGDFDRNKEPL